MSQDDRIAALEERIAELEDALKQRDARIKELTAERDAERELVAELREYHENLRDTFEQWKEGFDMQLSDKGAWGWSNFIEACDAAVDKYNALIKKWNKFVPEYNAAVAPHKRNFGRPLAASPAQKADVLKRRKADQSLRSIVDDTGLSFQTVRTIIGKAGGVDRATLARLKRIAPDKLAAARERANRKTRDALPGRINAMVKRGDELRKKLKGH